MSKGKKGNLKPKRGIQKKKGPKTAKEPKGVCFHCGKDGHWRWNCDEYKQSLKFKKKEHTDASASGIYTIEICSFSVSKSLWVLDTGCGYHLCNDMQGLKNSRKVSRGSMDY